MLGFGAALVLIGAGLALAGAGIFSDCNRFKRSTCSGSDRRRNYVAALQGLSRGIIENAKLFALGFLEVVRAFARNRSTICRCYRQNS